MFRCAECKKVSSPHDSSVKIVTKIRDKEYYYTDDYGNVLPVKPSYRKKKTGNVAKGFEIVEEKSVCQRCADERQKL